jgi:hypothetical protein
MSIYFYSCGLTKNGVKITFFFDFDFWLDDQKYGSSELQPQQMNKKTRLTNNYIRIHLFLNYLIFKRVFLVPFGVANLN